ncbi:MAG: flagellar biosynthetic protein FliQ [Nibricoccus sp.]
MNPEMAVDIFKNVILFALYIVSPFLGVMLVMGLITSLLQSVTSIQEQTLVFAPKLIAFALLCIAIGPWLLRSLSEFTVRTLSLLGTLGH